MLPDQLLQSQLILSVGEGFYIHHIQVAHRIEKLIFIQDVGHPPGHSGGKIHPGFAENHHDPTGHVFTTVVAQPLHHRHGAAVPDGEPFSPLAVDKDPARGGSAEIDVPGDDVAPGPEPGTFRRSQNNLPPGQPLTEIIIGGSPEVKGDSRRQKSPETLSRVPGEAACHRILPQPSGSVKTHQLGTQGGAHGTVPVTDRQVQGTGGPLPEGPAHLLQHHRI